MKKNLRWLLFYCFIASLIMTVVGVSFDMIYRNGYKPIMKKWRAEKEAELPIYLKEKTFFADHTFFRNDLEKKPDLGNHIESAIGPKPLLTTENRLTVLNLRNRWLSKSFRMPHNLPTEKIFSQLSKYQSLMTPFSGDAPEAFDYVIISQIHMVNMMRTKKPKLAKATEDAANLAELLMKSELLDDKLSALSIMDKVHEFKDYHRERTPAVKFSDEQLVSKDVLRRYRHFLFQTYDYLDFLVGKNVMEKVFLQTPLPPGFCAIFHKKEGHLQVANNYLNRRIPFEPNFSGESKNWNEIRSLAKEQCLLSIDRDQSKKLQSVANKIPFLRGLFGLAHLLRNKSLSGK